MQTVLKSFKIIKLNISYKSNSMIILQFRIYTYIYFNCIALLYHETRRCREFWNEKSWTYHSNFLLEGLIAKINKKIRSLFFKTTKNLITTDFEAGKYVILTKTTVETPFALFGYVSHNLNNSNNFENSKFSVSYFISIYQFSCILLPQLFSDFK